MSTLAVEINDAGIQTGGQRSADSGGCAPSPGFALIDGRTVLTGAEAFAASRLRPRQVTNRFWVELDVSPLGGPFRGEVTHADLAHAHLAAVWEQVKEGVDCVLLAVPGSNSADQLGLILGISRASEIPARGLVDSAIAAAGNGYPGDHLLHVDLQLHRVVVTELTQDQELLRERVQIGDHTGLAALHDRWVKHIAQSFIRNTRFDPLHSAATEQLLYSNLGTILDELSGAEGTIFELEGAGRINAVELTRAELVQVADRAYEGIVQIVRLLQRAGLPSTVLVSHRADGLPGLRSCLEQVPGAAVIALPADAVITGAIRNKDAIRAAGDELSFVTRLPVRGDVAREKPLALPVSSPGPTLRRHGRRPTHVLHEANAHPITGEPFRVGIAELEGARGVKLTGMTAGISRHHCDVFASEGRVVVEDRSTHGTFVNEQRIRERAEVVAGDVLRVGTPGIELRLIRVADEDGTTQG